MPAVTSSRRAPLRSKTSLAVEGSPIVAREVSGLSVPATGSWISFSAVSAALPARRTRTGMEESPYRILPAGSPRDRRAQAAERSTEALSARFAGRDADRLITVDDAIVGIDHAGNLADFIGQPVGNGRQACPDRARRPPAVLLPARRRDRSADLREAGGTRNLRRVRPWSAPRAGDPIHPRTRRSLSGFSEMRIVPAFCGVSS